MSDLKKYICTLPLDICKCRYRQEENCQNNQDGCGYKELENLNPSGQYIRKKRWYEELRR